MNDEQKFWDSIAKEQAEHVEPATRKKKIKVRVDKTVLEKFRKVEDELFRCRNPEQTAKGQKLLKKYAELKKFIDSRRIIEEAE